MGDAFGCAILATLAEDHTASRSRAGDTAATALTEGFRIGFIATAVTMVVGVLVAVLLLREDGRGEKVDIVGAQAAALEGSG
ncbi:hypothetical protein MXD59_21080 [Frankia sp. Ag45/Mut15]|uniref:Major facilitator superfamily (MFS) profile domain-containing protein n=1 Tax=Frankia umida TaxID=573489 RepID=A0ABT0K338_9ACTN|nr:hypothetical protein [Frankia umida]MCK9878231.1 hypothetical protein [Frankia umida]